MQEIFKEYENKSVNKGYTRNLYKGKKSVFFKNISLPRLKISSKSLNLSILISTLIILKEIVRTFAFL